jgi:signal transduction histidine kinase/ABC-type amino acid transport substrate-binding protein
VKTDTRTASHGSDPARRPDAAGAVRLAASLFLAGMLIATAPLQAQQRVRVGIYDNSPKIGFSEAGKPEGIFVDLLEAIAAKEGWSVEWIPGTWGEGLDRLASGQIDLMPDVALTPERAEKFAFHREPVLSSWNQVYARKRSGIRSLPDLAGRRVAVVRGSVQEDLFRQMVGAFDFKVTLVSQPDFEAAFLAVAENRADAVVTNRFYGAAHATAAGLEDTAIIFAPSRLFFAAPKGSNASLLAAIDRHLLSFKNDSGSVYYQSLRKWAADEPRPAVPRWIIFASLAAVGLLALAAMWLILLRREVSVRTAIIRRRNEQLAIVNRTLRSTGSSLDLRTVLEETTRGALELTGCDYGVLCVRDSESGHLNIGTRISAAGGSSMTADPIHGAACPKMLDRFTSGNGPAIFATDDPAAPPICCDLNDPALRWSVYFPFEAQGVSVGLLCLYSRGDEPPSNRDVQLVQELCIPVALAMENARLYEQAREHADELELRVTERTRELADAKHSAEAADRIKSAFLATMSHELRTPLNSIIGFTGIVCQELAGPLNDEQKRQLGMVRESAHHLLALINDVLDISKIEAGELAVGSDPFDLPSSIRKVARIVGPLAAKKGLTLSVKVADDVGEMIGDARRVEQILLNLVGNAIKFTESGSVTLTVDTVSDGALSSPAVRLSVADTGIGIKPEDMVQLFQPFRQIDSTLSRKHEGTGLGLTICRRLAALMDGRIEAESRPGEGSVFTLLLPVRTQALTEAS